uniref:Nucleoside diphosphate kinase n=1 Tax=Chelonoidis abingdonii TaxID=106734 RepID=A0A8C0IQS8_CHEAB
SKIQTVLGILLQLLAPPADTTGIPGIQERTLVAVKPDGVQRRLVGDVIKRFERRGFKLVGMKLLQVPACHIPEDSLVFCSCSGPPFPAGSGPLHSTIAGLNLIPTSPATSPTASPGLHYCNPAGPNSVLALKSWPAAPCYSSFKLSEACFLLWGPPFFQANEGLLAEHYHELRRKPFYPALIHYMTSGPVVAMVWEGYNVVRTSRAMVGDTDSAEAKPGTIRGDFSIHVSRNVVHASDSVETAQREISLWFHSNELVEWDCCDYSNTYQL